MWAFDQGQGRLDVRRFAPMDQLSPVRYLPALSAPAAASGQDTVRRIIVAGLLAAAAMVALHAVTQVIDFSVFDLRIRAFNADKRDSVFGLASLLAQLATATACWWRGHCLEQHRRVWFALAVLVAVLVFVRGLTSFNAVALALPLACVFVLLCFLTWRDQTAARAAVWAGLVLMVTSLVLHKVGLAADASTASDYTWAYQITGIVKHSAELAGWMLVTTGIVGEVAGRRARELTPAGIAAPRTGRNRPSTRNSAGWLSRRAGR